MSTWTNPQRHGAGRQESSSGQRSDERNSDPSLPRYPGQETQYNAPIFGRETQPVATTGRSREYVPVSRSNIRARELSVEFVKNAPLNDLPASQKFVDRNPEVLLEENLGSKYLVVAKRALEKGDIDSRTLAWAYMEKYSFIRLINSYKDKKKGDFLALLINKDVEATKLFGDTFNRVKEQCEPVSSTGDRHTRQLRESTEADDNVTAMKNLAITRSTAAAERGPSAQESQYRGSATQMETPRGDRHEPSPNRRQHRGDSQDRASTPRPLAAPATVHDPRFRKLEPREWRYFRPGRVFAIKTYNEFNSKPSTGGDDFSVEGARTTTGSEITTYIRRMLVVRTRNAFCLAVPINTYGGKGLKKIGLSESNINAHARIYMSNSRPNWLQGEPRTGKDDIKVEPEDMHQELLPTSRVCFERTHSIDYNEKVWKIGEVVDPGSLHQLLQYWEEENRRQSTGNRGRTNSAAGQGRQERARPPEPAPDRHRAKSPKRATRR